MKSNRLECIHLRGGICRRSLKGCTRTKCEAYWHCCECRHNMLTLHDQPCEGCYLSSVYETIEAVKTGRL